jgi:hypothetical protein
MELSILISNIILSMREFQKENNIKKQCITNTKYLYDIIRRNCKNDVKTKAVFVFSSDEEIGNNIVLGGHLVVVVDGEIIEPSYDIFSLKNKLYFDNIRDLIDIFDNKTELKTKIDIKKLMIDHIDFIKLAEKINKGQFLITEKKFYNEQADYIENLYSKQIFKPKNV